MAKQQHLLDRTKIESTEVVGYREQQSIIYSDSIIPSPVELEGYKKIDKNFPEFFMELTKEEQKHRFELKKALVESQEKDLKRRSRNEIIGYVFALFALLLLGGIVVLGFYFSYPWISAVVGGIGISAIVSSFIKGRSLEDKD